MNVSKERALAAVILAIVSVLTGLLAIIPGSLLRISAALGIPQTALFFAVIVADALAVVALLIIARRSGAFYKS